MIGTDISIMSGYAGGIAGRVTNSRVSDCYNTGSITVEGSNAAYAGGIVGDSSSVIEKCSNAGNVTATMTSGVGLFINQAHVGGIAGRSSSAIKDCYSLGNMSATVSGGLIPQAIAGGIAGTSTSSITNCYNTGDITASSTSTYYNGAIAGNSSTGSVSNCRFMGSELSAVGNGNSVQDTMLLTESEMKDVANFTGFDFIAVWAIDEEQNNGFPHLRFLSVPLIPVDKDALNAKIAEVENTQKGYFTDESWSTFQSALSAAQAVSSNEDATQAEVDSALETLNSAFSGLTLKPVDKTALNALIDEVKNTEKGYYTDASWTVFQNALAAAQSVAADSDATQAQVDNALSALNSAFSGLALKPVDKTALNALIDEVKNTEKGYYTDASWTVFENVLTAAQGVAADSDATQAQVDNAFSALNSAFSGLALKPVDKTALNALIDEVKNTEKGYYTDDSWNAFQSALIAAQAVAVNSNATQSQVDSALVALNSAFSSLTVKPVNKLALNTRINEVKDIQKGDYTDESWNAFQSALSAALTVAADADATQTQVDGALVDLNSAFSGLTLKPVNKAILNARIDEVKNTLKGYYTDASWNAFQSALSAAQTVAADTGATQTQVDGALATLNSAFSDLTLKPVDKTTLNTRIDEVKNTQKGNYTDDSWSAFQSALSTAQAVANNNLATQVEVNNALAALNTAYTNLKGNTTPPASYTVTLNANGGSVTPASVSQMTGTTYTLPTPTRSGYTFTGWTLSGGGSLSGSTYTFGTSNGTVTAQWTQQAKKIFPTKYDATFLNWILFFVCFGWIWMWF